MQICAIRLATISILLVIAGCTYFHPPMRTSPPTEWTAVLLTSIDRNALGQDASHPYPPTVYLRQARADFLKLPLALLAETK